MKPSLSIKIDLNKIAEEHVFQGEKGRYLDIAVWPNRDGADKFGNQYFVTQSVSKEARERGIKGPIVGNGRKIGDGGQAVSQPTPPRHAPPPKAGPVFKDSDDGLEPHF